MRLAIGCDHIVVDLKDQLRDWLIEMGHEVVDCGTYDKKRTHYPIYGKAVAEHVVGGVVDLGIVLCGTGVGITNAAQKVHGARVALVRDVATAKAAKEIYNANIIGVGGRITGIGMIEDIIMTFLNTEFDENNQENVKLIDQITKDGKGDLYQQTFEEFLEKWDAGFYEERQ